MGMESPQTSIAGIIGFIRTVNHEVRSWNVEPDYRKIVARNLLF